MHSQPMLIMSETGSRKGDVQKFELREALCRGSPEFESSAKYATIRVHPTSTSAPDTIVKALGSGDVDLSERRASREELF